MLFENTTAARHNYAMLFTTGLKEHRIWETNRHIYPRLLKGLRHYVS